MFVKVDRSKGFVRENKKSRHNTTIHRKETEYLVRNQLVPYVATTHENNLEVHRHQFESFTIKNNS